MKGTARTPETIRFDVKRLIRASDRQRSEWIVGDSETIGGRSGTKAVGEAVVKALATTVHPSI
ncbi:MAG: hypothetical protein ACRD22_02340 [Terriglobia bacterium]